MPDPTVALNPEDKHRKQAFELLNMAQVSKKLRNRFGFYYNSILE
jgi:hypothetical protein